MTLVELLVGAGGLVVGFLMGLAVGRRRWSGGRHRDPHGRWRVR